MKYLKLYESHSRDELIHILKEDPTSVELYDIEPYLTDFGVIYLQTYSNAIKDARSYFKNPDNYDGDDHHDIRGYTKMGGNGLLMLIDHYHKIYLSEYDMDLEEVIIDELDDELYEYINDWINDYMESLIKDIR